SLVHSSVCDSLISECWATPPREKSDFLSAGLFHRVRTATFRALGHSIACESRLSKRWIIPPRENCDFLSAGLFHRVRIATFKVLASLHRSEIIIKRVHLSYLLICENNY